MELSYKESDFLTFKKIGSGIDARIYLDDTKTCIDRDIALKRYAAPDIYSHSKIKLIEMLSEKDIPCITRPIDHFKVDDDYFGYYMEYFKGVPLNERKISYNEKIKVLYKIKEALACLHRNDILFPDLRPANVLINDNNDIKLCDLDGMKSEGHTPNMVNICANEYIKLNKKYGIDIDIYLFNLLTLFYLLDYTKEEIGSCLYTSAFKENELNRKDFLAQVVLNNKEYSKRYIIDDKELQKETKLII